MTTHHEDIIERTSREIRDEVDRFDPEVERAALDRVWEEISDAAAPAAGEVLTCDDIAGLLPAYRSGDLKHERSMLIKEHVRDCLTCRRRLREIERGETAVERPARRTLGAGWKWGIAAALVLGLGMTQLFVVGRLANDGGVMMRVVEGELFSLSDATAVEHLPGTEIPYGESVVVRRGESAVVELADGSLVEFRERSRFAVGRTPQGTTIDLESGDVIVEAADQKNGHLYVETDECRVEVTGTVFAVSHGTRGSRVSVYEGSVLVNGGGAEHNLAPGDQVTTSESLAARPLDEEIAWSTNRERHLALVQELIQINEDLRSLPWPDRRYDTAWLDRLPASTALYAAVPNLSGTIEETVARLKERVAANPVLSEWIGQRESFYETTTVIEWLAGLGDLLGEEIVIAAWHSAAEGSDDFAPAVIAEALDPETLRMRIEVGLAVLATRVGATDVVLTDDPYAADLPEDALILWVGDDVLAIAPGRTEMVEVVDALEGGGGIADAAFYDTIASRYADGVEALIAVDLNALITRDQNPEEMARLESLGLADVRHVVVEQWKEGEQTRRQAVVSFDEERRGLAAWLAAPAPMGALSFFSPDTTSVAAFVVQEPGTMFAEILASMTAEDRAEIEAELARLEAEYGFDLEADVFGPIGGEVAMGIDGPMVPQPSWKAVLEVYDPATLQFGLERLVTEINQHMFEQGDGESLELVQSAIGGHDSWIVTATKADGTVDETHYLYADGYLVATPTAALLDRALRYRDAELGLLHSDRLRDLLPPGEEINVSALWYQDISDILDPLGNLVSGMTEGMEQMPDEMRDTIGQIGEYVGPSLYFAYGEADRIRISGTSTHNPLGLINLLMMQGLGLEAMNAGPGAQDG